MKFLKNSFLIALLSAAAGYSTTAAATTVAEYEAVSALSIQLTSATYSSSGEDAWGALSTGTWDDTGDTGYSSSGAGDTTFAGTPSSSWEADEAFSREITASGSASADETSSQSWIGDYALPSIHYDHDCMSGGVNGCDGVDSIEVELTYSLETSVSAEVLDPVSGDASASASSFLGVRYFSADDTPFRSSSWDFQTTTSGNALTTGVLSFTMEAGSMLGFMLSSNSISGFASYSAAPLVATPIPSSIPLMLSGLVCLGWVSRYRRKRAA